MKQLGIKDAEFINAFKYTTLYRSASYQTEQETDPKIYTEFMNIMLN